MDKYLCRYQKIDKNLKESLMQSYQWFSDPILDFNDPYDCNLGFAIYFERDKNLMTNHYRHANDYFRAVGMPFLNQNELNEKIDDLCNTSKLEEITQEKVRDSIGGCGICCFSKADDILLMWSHYADKHQGLCLKFDFNKDREFFNMPFDVHYPEKLQLFDYYRNNLNRYSGILQFLFATKSKDWGYEQEARIVKESCKGKFRGEIAFKKEALVEVIFGYKTKQEDIQAISRILKKRNYSPTLYQMKLKEDDFGLVKMPLSDSPPQNNFHLIKMLLGYFGNRHAKAKS